MTAGPTVGHEEAHFVDLGEFRSAQHGGCLMSRRANPWATKRPTSWTSANTGVRSAKVHP